MIPLLLVLDDTDCFEATPAGFADVAAGGALIAALMAMAILMHHLLRNPELGALDPAGLRTRWRDAAAALGVEGVLRRPRMLRGPYTETPFDARLISTPRLTLRPYALSDAAEYFELRTKPTILRHLSWPRRTEDESREHLRTRIRQTRLWQADDFLAFAVELDGRLIGDASLHLRIVSADVRTVEIGWILHPDFSGHGYATEASFTVAQLAFRDLKARSVVAVADSHNSRSLSLAHRLGFRETHRSSTVFMTLAESDLRRGTEMPSGDRRSSARVR